MVIVALILSSLALICSIIALVSKKEGPQGPKGDNGKDGKDGKDGESVKLTGKEIETLLSELPEIHFDKSKVYADSFYDIS